MEPSEEKVAALGEILNSNTLAQVNVALSSSAALRACDAEAIALIVDGLPARNRTTELTSSTSSAVLPSWAWISLTLLLIGVFVMVVIIFYSMHTSKASKRGGLTYTRSASISEEFVSDQEVEMSSSDGERH